MAMTRITITNIMDIRSMSQCNSKCINGKNIAMTVIEMFEMKNKTNEKLRN